MLGPTYVFDHGFVKRLSGVYLLREQTGHYYVGQAADIGGRLYQHNNRDGRPWSDAWVLAYGTTAADMPRRERERYERLAIHEALAMLGPNLLSNVATYRVRESELGLEAMTLRRAILWALIRGHRTAYEVPPWEAWTREWLSGGQWRTAGEARWLRRWRTDATMALGGTVS